MRSVVIAVVTAAVVGQEGNCSGADAAREWCQQGITTHGQDIESIAPAKDRVASSQEIQPARDRVIAHAVVVGSPVVETAGVFRVAEMVAKVPLTEPVVEPIVVSPIGTAAVIRMAEVVEPRKIPRGGAWQMGVGQGRRGMEARRNV